MKKDARGPRIVLAGSVGSSRRILAGLIRHKANLAGVLGLHNSKSSNVSDYSRLDDLARGAGVPYQDFEDINDHQIRKVIQKWAPDLLFVVGLSQLVKEDLLKIPGMGCVGFHPTRLPEGRGRAPVAWMALENRSGAATFFKMNADADSGPILAQENFNVSQGDYAADIIRKMEEAIDRALDDWLPRLINGEWQPRPQDDSTATFYGRRLPADGLIDWRQTSEEILALIRATSHPHPGAYTYASGTKLIVWKGECEKRIPYRGVVGRILMVDKEKGPLVKTGDGLIWLSDFEFSSDEGESLELKVGMKLGIAAEDEIVRLKQTILNLEERLSRLEGERKAKP
jgi:methionyl-tRNA formyltransferase